MMQFLIASMINSRCVIIQRMVKLNIIKKTKTPEIMVLDKIDKIHQRKYKNYC